MILFLGHVSLNCHHSGGGGLRDSEREKLKSSEMHGCRLQLRTATTYSFRELDGVLCVVGALRKLFRTAMVTVVH